MTDVARVGRGGGITSCRITMAQCYDADSRVSHKLLSVDWHQREKTNGREEEEEEVDFFNRRLAGNGF